MVFSSQELHSRSVHDDCSQPSDPNFAPEVTARAAESLECEHIIEIIASGYSSHEIRSRWVLHPRRCTPTDEATCYGHHDSSIYDISGSAASLYAKFRVRHVSQELRVRPPAAHERPQNESSLSPSPFRLHGRASN